MPPKKNNSFSDFDILSDLDARLGDLEKGHNEQSQALVKVSERLEATADQLQLTATYINESHKSILESQNKILDKLERSDNSARDHDARLVHIENRFEKRDKRSAYIKNSIYGLVIAGITVFVTKMVETWLGGGL